MSIKRSANFGASRHGLNTTEISEKLFRSRMISCNLLFPQTTWIEKSDLLLSVSSGFNMVSLPNRSASRGMVVPSSNH